ncbi:MAG TPA: hypothetical protein VJ624_01030, partial [Thermodesulfobacteriota bacterium]|nr:hypothetical protein [Thermodesulfobacteriota bacterium]
MKKVFVLFLLFFLLALSSAKEASAAGTHVDVSTSTQTVNAVEASPSQEINSNSEAQPLQMQELSFIYPSGLFVNASDLRNIMDLLRFIHENPCPYRWQLKKWAKGGYVDVIMSTTNDKGSKSDNDRICLFLEIEDFFWIWARDPKTGNIIKDSKTGKL